MTHENNRLTGVTSASKEEITGTGAFQIDPSRSSKMLTRNSNFDEIYIPDRDMGYTKKTTELSLQAKASNPPAPKMKKDTGQKIELKNSLRETPWKCTKFSRFVNSKGTYEFKEKEMHSNCAIIAQKTVVFSTTFVSKPIKTALKTSNYIPSLASITVSSGGNIEMIKKICPISWNTNELWVKDAHTPWGYIWGLPPIDLTNHSDMLR